MRWDRFTVAPRKLRLLLAVVTAVVALGALVGAYASAPAQTAADVAPSPSRGHDRLVGMDPDQMVRDAPADGEVHQQAASDDATDAEQEAAAWQAAADFAAGYASHRFDDGPGSTVERVRPFVTEELADQLAGGSGAAAASAERAARQEVVLAEVQAVQPQGGSVSEGRLELLVVVRQDVTWNGGSRVDWPTYLLEVRQGPGGWRVSRLLP